MIRIWRRSRPFADRYGAAIWLGIVVVLAGSYAYHHQQQMAEIATQIAVSDLRWISVAIVAEAVVLALVARTYQSLLQRLGHRVSCAALVVVHLHRVLVGAITPVSGPASLYVYVRHLARRGISTDDALLAAALRSVTAYGAFIILLVPALILHHPSALTALGGAVLVLLFAVTVWAFALLCRGFEFRHRWQRIIPRRARMFAHRVRCHGVRPRDLVRPLGLALAVRLTGAAMLYASLRAVGENPSLTVPLVAYIVGILFMMVAPVFGGAGVVEVATAVVLERLGVPAGAAVGAAILARLAEFWLPLALGLVVHLTSTAHGGVLALSRRGRRRSVGSWAPASPRPGRGATPVARRTATRQHAVAPIRIP